MPETTCRPAFALERAMLIAFNKPFGVLSQFTPVAGKRTLADFIDIGNVYPAGRLDHDSEGLLLLTDHGPLQHAIADPSHGAVKHYWAQVEGIPSDQALARFASGLTIGDGAEHYRTRPARVETMTMPMFPEREPPIRTRLAIPTAWLSIRIAEGRNRQVRRMTAAIGHPTLRLIRAAIGDVDLAALGLAPGRWCEVNPARLGAAFGASTAAADGAKPPAARTVSTGFRKRRYWG